MAKKFEYEKKVFTQHEKNEIRNKWCDQLCEIFLNYYKNGEKEPIRTPLYTAQVLSTFGLIDFNLIDFKEAKTNIMGKNSHSNNEKLIYECFDRLIEKRSNLNAYMHDFRKYYNDEEMPY